MSNKKSLSSPQKTPPFIVLGTGGNFTRQVLQSLVDQQTLPVVYIQWQRSQREPQTTGSIGIPLQVNRRMTELEAWLQEHRIHQTSTTGKVYEVLRRFTFDYLLVACWPSLLSQSVIHSADKAALNLHPSLLPKYRGYDPIGEQLRQQDYEFGVTLHHLTNQYDRGPIVAQKKIEISRNLEKKNIEIACAEVGARLFSQAIGSA